ncbi:hypothetical protein KDK95_15810 [Actinospica sp. MGRD01-02]|uniref:PPC domain-containing protein n=1 Tax=Actinospica acidithermotolerans TaxID=2828514 RepID=A0A941ECD7_9ACTN|nr:DUF296 domain-containing protein [Actinospica acidithermotolerans]MBR7827785.1 hypothetical protein [Actinospica acidithermotolerans]
MKAAELTVGRTFGVTFEHGEDFFESLAAFCREHGVRQGYIPSFIAGLAEAPGQTARIVVPEAVVRGGDRVALAHAHVEDLRARRFLDRGEARVAGLWIGALGFKHLSKAPSGLRRDRIRVAGLGREQFAPVHLLPPVEP